MANFWTAIGFGKNGTYLNALLKKTKNIVTAGEIAKYEHFLPLSYCFQNSSALNLNSVTVVKVPPINSE